jgi:hypothetical protein
MNLGVFRPDRIRREVMARSEWNVRHALNPMLRRDGAGCAAVSKRLATDAFAALFIVVARMRIPFPMAGAWVAACRAATMLPTAGRRARR